VREGLRVHIALSGALQSVVAHRRRRAQRFIYVSLADEIALLR
jgi:hypothetical protein